jgi:threonine dehydrogenase-like Zn-dependent dehydrogenase
MCGHAEYGVKDAEKVFALPPELDLEQAVASYWAVPAIRGIQRLAPRVYDDVAVVGQGPIGLMALQILRHWAGRLVAVDVNPLRLAKSAQLGADLCVNPLQQDLVGEVSKLLPEGPQRVLEASGTREGLRSALEIVRPRGLVATLRIAADLSGLAMEHYVYRKDLRIVASGAPGMAPPRQYLAEARPLLSATAADVWPDAWHFSRQIRASLEMLRRGYIQAEPVISHRVRYDQVLDIYRQLCDRSQPPSLIGVVINWE